MAPIPTEIDEGSPPVDRRALDNGLRVLTTPMAHTRSATISVYVGAGSRYERDEDAGISHLVEHCCFKGTTRRPNASDISTAIEGVGGVLNAGTDRELTVYYAKVPSPHVETALDVVLDIVGDPLFEENDLEKERQVILEELAMVEDTPNQLVEVMLDGLLWPAHPLGRDVAGTPESVRAIPRETTMAYWRDQYTPANALVSVAGAVDADAIAHLIEKQTAGWEVAQATGWRPVNGDGTGGSRIAVHEKATEQAHLMLGLPGLAADHPDRYVLSLLTSVLGDGMSSRLFISLREDLGLAYDVHAFSSNLRDTGAIVVYLGVDPENALPALEATLQELERMREPVPLEELSKAREYIKGRMLLNMEDTRAVSAWNGAQALLREEIRSVEEVVAALEAVRVEDLERVAATMIDAAALKLGVVGPFTDEACFAEALHF